jgi:deoxyribonuclease-4
MSITGGVEFAPARAASVGCTAMQIFVKNNNRWEGKPITPEQASRFRDELDKAGIALAHVFAHTGYLINLASAKDDVRLKSEASLEDELRRCHLLGLPGIVMHPGAHLGQGREKGIELIASACRRVFDRIGDSPTRLLFETTVGSGTNMGGTFEDLRDVLAAVDRPDRVGVCMDTCHIFAAGYEIRTPESYAATMSQLDTVVGLAKVKAIHLNDSKGDLASRKDRHAHIGEGFIGLEGFRHLLNDERFRLVPMSLETEKGEDLAEDRQNLAVLRSLVV